MFILRHCQLKTLASSKRFLVIARCSLTFQVNGFFYFHWETIKQPGFMFDLIPEIWMPLFIFIARIWDVSLGTVRIIFVSRGMKFKAAALGFIEVLIWITVVAQLIQHLGNWINLIAYAGGFSVGTYLGIILENKLKVGTIIVRIITHENSAGLAINLRKAGFRITSIQAEGQEGPVEIIFSVLKRKRWSEIVHIIESFNKDAFYSVEDVKYSSAGSDTETVLSIGRSAFDRLLRIRKGI